MATAKVTNFNALRPVIITAHNNGNSRAITKDMVIGAGIDIQYFNSWQVDVNALRHTVDDYIAKKRAVKYGYQIGGRDITADDVFAAKELIFPKWKDILQVGEEKKDKRELHVDPDDVEDLVGFAWDFTDSGHGTVEHVTSEQVFRKKVESLLGCAIAKNAVLCDDDRDTLDKFKSAQRRIQNAIDKTAELESKKQGHELTLGGIPAENKAFRDFVQNMITAVEEELKKVAEAKTNAEADLAEISGKAKLVLNKIKYVK